MTNQDRLAGAQWVLVQLCQETGRFFATSPTLDIYDDPQQALIAIERLNMLKWFVDAYISLISDEAAK